MNNSEYFSYDALGLAELIRTKQISSSELLEVAIGLTEKLAPKLNSDTIIIVNSCGDAHKDRDIFKQRLGSYIRWNQKLP